MTRQIAFGDIPSLRRVAWVAFVFVCRTVPGGRGARRVSAGFSLFARLRAKPVAAARPVSLVLARKYPGMFWKASGVT